MELDNKEWLLVQQETTLVMEANCVVGSPVWWTQNDHLDRKIKFPSLIFGEKANCFGT